MRFINEWRSGHGAQCDAAFGWYVINAKTRFHPKGRVESGPHPTQKAAEKALADLEAATTEKEKKCAPSPTSSTAAPPTTPRGTRAASTSSSVRTAAAKPSRKGPAASPRSPKKDRQPGRHELLHIDVSAKEFKALCTMTPLPPR